jgi:hypothetical protein
MADNVDDLRSEIARLRKAVTRKVSRLKQTHDVYLSGTQFDPRRAPRTESKYDSRQLRSYANDLAGFLDRGNQFVPDARNRPIPRDEWRTYKRLESQYNKRVDAYFEQMKDIRLPGFAGQQGETLGQRMAKMTPDHRQMGNVNVNAPFQPPNREEGTVSDRSRLAKLTADMRNRLEPGYFGKLIEDSKEQFRQMADLIDEPDLKGLTEGITDEQWAALWNYTPFATGVSILYENQLKLLSDKEKPYNSDILRNSVAASVELAKWARTLKIGG